MYYSMDGKILRRYVPFQYPFLRQFGSRSGKECNYCAKSKKQHKTDNKYLVHCMQIHREKKSPFLSLVG